MKPTKATQRDRPQPSMWEDKGVTPAERGLWRQPAETDSSLGCQTEKHAGGLRATTALPKTPTHPLKRASHAQKHASVHASPLQRRPDPQAKRFYQGLPTPGINHRRNHSVSTPDVMQHYNPNNATEMHRRWAAQHNYSGRTVQERQEIIASNMARGARSLTKDPQQV